MRWKRHDFRLSSFVAFGKNVDALAYEDRISSVIDAVSHLGVRHIDMPVNGLRVWEALQEAAQAPAPS